MTLGEQRATAPQVWGDHGYIQLKKGAGGARGMCGLATQPTVRGRKRPHYTVRNRLFRHHSLPRGVAKGYYSPRSTILNGVRSVGCQYPVVNKGTAPPVPPPTPGDRPAPPPPPPAPI